MAQLNTKLENLTISTNNKKKKDARRIRKRLSISEAKNQSPLLLDGVKKKNKYIPLQNKSNETNKSDLFNSFSMKSQVGMVPFNPNKANQDRAIAVTDLFEKTSSPAALFGVFDGHGMYGDDVSQYLSDKMEDWYKNAKHKDLIIKDPENALKQCYNDLTESLLKSKINCNFSGTTAVVTYMDKENLYTANVGDSRCILCRKENNRLIAVPLSFDQKPDDLNEKKRIEAHNGRVESCRGPMGELIGPARVWLKNHDMPGLAMSRSFGDDMATSVGVISEPHIIIKKRTKNDQFIVAASDGIWEFLSNEDVVDIVSKNKNDPKKASRILCKEATKQWQKEEEVIDDITCVIVNL